MVTAGATLSQSPAPLLRTARGLGLTPRGRKGGRKKGGRDKADGNQEEEEEEDGYLAARQWQEENRGETKRGKSQVESL